MNVGVTVLLLALNMVLHNKRIAYPSIALITANPLIVIISITGAGVDLFTKLTKVIIAVVFIAGSAQEPVLGMFNLRPEFLVDFLGIAQLVETLLA